MTNVLYDGARNAFRAAFMTAWRMHIHGAENVPRTGAAIVACNHLSYLDPPVLGSACPRRIAYMAKSQLFAIPVLGPAIAAVGAYPVDREGSATAAIKRSVEVLREGRVIGIFPEGTRNREGTAEARGGAALLSSLAKVPVVPACITGTAKALRLHRFDVYFGPPMALPADRKATREDLANFTDQLMRAIRTLPETTTG